MKYLFMDNFRGFRRTILPIKDINFFVGENSTGKTSVLSLINLFASSSFWFNPNFDLGGTEFGNYDDIVSISTTNKSYFSVGMIETTPNQEKDGLSCSGFLMTFKKSEGMPSISRYSYIDGNQEITVKYSGNNARFKHEKMCDISNDQECIFKIFLKWFESHQETGRGYKTIKEYSELKVRYISNLVIVPSLIRDILSKKYPDIVTSKSKGIFPSLFTKMTWLAPIRTKPKKTYDRYDIVFSPEGEHTPYLIKKLIATEKVAENFLAFVKEFGEESGLFESIEVKKYGRAVTSPFEIDIILGKEALKIVNVGYGVSQALPIIVELFIGQDKSWFAIQQPEIHLHPRAQAAMGKLFYTLAVLQKKKFIVETHSDHTIDNFRISYRKESKSLKPEAQVVFFERSAEGNKLCPIEILENGDLSENQPVSYRDFFMKEQMRLLGL